MFHSLFVRSGAFRNISTMSAFSWLPFAVDARMFRSDARSIQARCFWMPIPFLDAPYMYGGQAAVHIARSHGKTSICN
jgi:hypothetical protein